MSGWIAVETPGGVHVLPVDDVVEHSMDLSCPCNPEIELVNGAENCGVQYIRKMYTHDAFDGRE